MKKQWFVLHSLTGQEMKARDTIIKTAAIEELDEFIEEVIVPVEKVYEKKKGKTSTITRKFFPGYILINVALYNEEGEMNENVWHFLRGIQGVIGFLGGEKPAPLRQSEVDDILNQSEEEEVAKPKIEFEIGETVKINDGAFMNFNGVVEGIDPERGKLKVTVAIFGRNAPVELEYWQAERVE
ncbi:MAG: transcription termination/antitermination protein NusG [Kiritimatiellae bacterium]|jgi:transcriptional antiterminator NusG|nr:transcription termination/antitermination protein NusG [Kiritimatiellia bacterium]